MDYLVKGETLEAIAESIRERSGTTESYTVSEFPAAILAITGGANPLIASSDAEMEALLTDNEGKVVYNSVSGTYAVGYYVIVNGAYDRLYLGSEIPTTDLEVTENDVYTFDGVGGYKQVTVNVQPALQNKTKTPTETEQSVVADEGYYGLSEVVINPIPSDYIKPSGGLVITENGEHDVKVYATVTVDVDTSLEEYTGGYENL